jgi:aspartyl-tRNA(Asn)/glutamyl-tRNA(Gln) amidotransferase subunit A
MARVPEEVFFESLGQIHARLVKKEFSARDLARDVCDRLERQGPRYNALALLLRDEAMRRARDVDREIGRQRIRGPLQGIPFAVKDLLSLEGHPTTWGAKPYAGQVLGRTATVLRKLSGAGAGLCGKLAMIELAGGGGYRSAGASLTGPGLNPWDRTKWAGGSSSGSAAAVAAGLVPFSLGSETSGSIVTPAAFCGVTALRPTYGLVSRAGAMALSWTLDKIGPFARTAEDCGHILQAIAGGDLLDPGSAGKGFRYVPEYTRPAGEYRAGYAESDIEESAEEALRPALRTAVAVLKGILAEMKRVELPDLPFGAAISTIISTEGSAAFRQLIESGGVDQLADERQIAGLRAGLEVPAWQYLEAMRVRRQVQVEFAKLFQEVDVLVAPARLSTAPAVAEPLDRASGRRPARAGGGLRAIIAAGNLAGLPALVLPCGFAEGMPVGLTLVGRPFSENALLAVGVEFQNRTDWHRRKPVLPVTGPG